MAGDDDAGQFLMEYLEDALPALGLEAETYGPYMTGYADGDDEDEDTLDDLIELLRASSETHSDDEDAWTAFRAEIIKRKEDFIASQQTKKEEDSLMLKKKEEERLKKDIELARDAEAAREAAELAKETKEMDPAKKALLDQYAYDQESQYDDEGNLVVDEEEDAPLSNRKFAAQQSQEQRDELKKGSGVTKRQSQEATAKAKMDKNRQKEERRKRATKGERKS
mmetsp:Transcript_13205/g.23956  ORF Transcript_13205/g.23956 Transcript_13205/m.23956 type:complete len:224 (-) Transcript_13205:206-877(-)|eukprot:CAMPEP_0198294578 /NCGR_PEP_ID=MMETSP1449-20131203/23146_1 /TAXON_ID=420275 /ORGANISM="Attheya septentrionalis, Strain CCMP2084" /LENGTH=223 /DNA_ID=CAMNT_0043994569 /DNA_START=15 /DNA_END=686 /DNA_ORIENTATION=-